VLWKRLVDTPERELAAEICAVRGGLLALRPELQRTLRWIDEQVRVVGPKLTAVEMHEVETVRAWVAKLIMVLDIKDEALPHFPAKIAAKHEKR